MPESPPDTEADRLIADLTPVQRLALFGVLVAQVHDIHAVVYNFSAEQADACLDLVGAFERKDSPYARIVSASAAVTAYDLDHPPMTEAEEQAGLALLAALEGEFGPVNL